MTRTLFDNLGENETTEAALVPSSKKRPLLTAEQLAEHLGVSRSWLYKRVASGSIPNIKFGTAIRFDVDEVIAFFKQKED